jgi:MFS family permease
MGDPSDYETLFSLLYTLYSAPNVILPFFGGYFVDVFGVRLCLLIFASLIAVGQIIFSLGLSIKSWPVLFLGRLVFGFGGESLTVANSALLADWFKGKELAFAFGINLAIARLGSVINNVVSPALARTTGVLFASWFGVILCAASVFCVVITLPIDRNMDIKRKLYLNESSGIQGLLKLDEDINDDVDMEQVRNSLLNKDSSSISNFSSSSSTAAVAVEANGKTINYVKGINDDEKKSNGNDVKLADVFSFSRMFWMLVALCVIVYGKFSSIFGTHKNQNQILNL